MTTETRALQVIVGSEAPSLPPEARNALIVVGSRAPSLPPEARNALVVVGSVDPAHSSYTYGDYPNWTGVETVVGPGGDLAGAVSDADPYDKITYEGDHTGEGKITVPASKPLWINGADRANSKAEQIYMSGDLEGPWLTNQTISRDTVDGAIEAGFRHTGGVLSRARFSRLTITGDGLLTGIQLSRNYQNFRNVADDVIVHTIQQRAFEWWSDYMMTWGLQAFNLRKVSDIGGDVDAMRFCGVGQRHYYFWFRDNIADESISTDNTGSFDRPHLDGAQTFEINLLGGDRWETSDILFQDGIVDYRTGGDHGATLENNNTATRYVSDIRFNRVKMSGIGSSIVNVLGVDGFSMTDSDLWITESSAVTFGAISFGSGGNGGPTTNPNAVLDGTTLYRADGQQLVSGAPGDLTEIGSTFVEGDPSDLLAWNQPVIPSAPEASILAWLNASSGSAGASRSRLRIGVPSLSIDF